MDVRTILIDQGGGPVTVTVDDEWEHELQLDEAEMQEDGFHAEAHDRTADGVRFRFITPKADDHPLTLERRHARDDEWEEIGEVTHVEAE